MQFRSSRPNAVDAPPSPPNSYTLIGDAGSYCSPTAGQNALLDRCEFTGSSATQTASVANCQAACNAVADCVAIGFKLNNNCGLHLSVTVSSSTCPTGSTPKTDWNNPVTSCNMVYGGLANNGRSCYRRGCSG